MNAAEFYRGWKELEVGAGRGFRPRLLMSSPTEAERVFHPPLRRDDTAYMLVYREGPQYVRTDIVPLEEGGRWRAVGPQDLAAGMHVRFVPTPRGLVSDDAGFGLSWDRKLYIARGSVPSNCYELPLRIPLGPRIVTGGGA
jgi:hypothetical protein